MFSKQNTIMNDSYESDFEATFSHDSFGRVKADIVNVERFVDKYRTLIERVNDVHVEPVNPFKCVDFTRRKYRMYTLGSVTNEYLKAEKDMGFTHS